MRTKSITFIALLVITGTQLLFAQKFEKRTLPTFSEISLRTSATIHLSQADDQSVELNGKEDALDKLITEVKDGKLIIRYPEKYKNNLWNQMRGDKHVDINITMSQIDGLALESSGSIFADDKIDTKNLDLWLTGTGNLRIGKLNAEKVSANLSGTGNLYLTGGQHAVSEFISNISGTGSVKALALEANDVNVDIGGTGNCWITANKKLVVRIGGTGNVHYQGNPVIDSNIGGTGRLKAEK